jgi:hypothetical protein
MKTGQNRTETCKNNAAYEKKNFAPLPKRREEPKPASTWPTIEATAMQILDRWLENVPMGRDTN